MFKFCLYKVGLLLLRVLPPRWSYNLALFVSDMQYRCSFRDRAAVKNNLRKICSSSQNIPVLTREVFRNFGRYLVEFFQIREMVDEHFIRKKVNITGIEYLDQVLSRGKGGILVTAHIGNWELGAVLMSVLGYPIMAVALPHKERPVNDLFNAQREAKGVTVVPTNVALRKCIAQIRDNKFVALVADRDFSHQGIEMDLMGCKALLPKGPAVFSLKTGAPIIPTFLLRNGDGTFNLECLEPIYPAHCREEKPGDDKVRRLMHKYIRVIEDKIRTYPSQWLLFREFCIS